MATLGIGKTSHLAVSVHLYRTSGSALGWVNPVKEQRGRRSAVVRAPACLGSEWKGTPGPRYSTRSQTCIPITSKSRVDNYPKL